MVWNNVLQKLLIYEFCYSEDWQNREEWAAYLRENRERSGFVCVFRAPAGVCVAELCDSMGELIGDLFEKPLIGMPSDMELVALLLQKDPPGHADRSVLVEKCNAVYERIRLIFDLELRIGIGAEKEIGSLRESWREAAQALGVTSFPVIHYADLSSDPDNAHTDTVVRFMRFLGEHFSEPISICDAAKAGCVSCSYLSSILKEKTGKTYIAHLTEIRIQKAKELLLQSEMAVKTVGQRVGYPDAIYFNRVFKNQIGMTPGEYRKRFGARGERIAE